MQNGYLSYKSITLPVPIGRDRTEVRRVVKTDGFDDQRFAFAEAYRQLVRNLGDTLLALNTKGDSRVALVLRVGSMDQGRGNRDEIALYCDSSRSRLPLRAVLSEYVQLREVFLRTGVSYANPTASPPTFESFTPGPPEASGSIALAFDRLPEESWQDRLVEISESCPAGLELVAYFGSEANAQQFGLSRVTHAADLFSLLWSVGSGRPQDGKQEKSFPELTSWVKNTLAVTPQMLSGNAVQVTLDADDLYVLMMLAHTLGQLVSWRNSGSVARFVSGEAVEGVALAINSIVASPDEQRAGCIRGFNAILAYALAIADTLPMTGQARELLIASALKSIAWDLEDFAHSFSSFSENVLFCNPAVSSLLSPAVGQIVWSSGYGLAGHRRSSPQQRRKDGVEPKSIDNADLSKGPGEPSPGSQT